MDGLEDEWGETVNVLLLNVQEPAARPLLTELNFRYTPTFILFDEQGNEIWRSSGSLNPDEINEQINALSDIE
ncbi:MAG: hypothetical protein GY796_10795 [Chloroflexi bacterium]|nr:hypothetical protein [Chloroflexota bacterium]